jgi:hypothetical protein
MSLSGLKYKLSNGFIHNWLIAGPRGIPVTKIKPDTEGDIKLTIIQDFYDPDVGISEIPVDLGALGSITSEDPLLRWRYNRCREDHFVDFSAFYPTCHYLLSWAYAQVVVPFDCEVTLNVITNSATDLWLNGKHLYRQESIQEQQPQRNPVSAMLQSGTNEILCRLANVGIRETDSVMALQIQGISDDDIEIVIPTDIELNLVKKRQILEKLVESAYLDRYIYGNLWGDRYNKNQPIPLFFPSELDVYGEITQRLQSLAGDIFQEVTKTYEAGSSVELAKTFPLRNGPHHLVLLPTANDYYVKKLRFERKHLFYVVRTPYSQTPYGNHEQRVLETLKDASQRRNESIYSEIAKAASDQWQDIDWKIITKAIERVNIHEDGSVCDLLGILGMRLRFKNRGKISGSIRSTIKECILGYRYWADAQADDVMNFRSESKQILFHTCEILAGQLFPNATFRCTGNDGSWHKDHGKKLAVEWLRQRGQFGFEDWDSPGSFEEILAALAHLVDLVRSESIREMASVLMDKIFFSMAANSFQGAYGSTRGKTDTASVLSARLEPTSGIFRLMWGLGNYNENVMGTVSLACCKQYEIPDTIYNIGVDTPSAFWNREHHQGDAPKPWEVNKVVYRTKNFMLSSAQDYHPGQRGRQEHIWQATLGPDAIVYVNHPTCMSEDDTHQPNLWSGNGVLPRVAQWGDVLIAIYQLPQDDWLGFTHAYFPAVTFDEYHLHEKWAFARMGDGYLALFAENGLEFIRNGQAAYRELRSYGRENFWICQMGQKILDGSFDEFQAKVLGVKVNIENFSVSINSLRGDGLSFGWDGAFVVNNQEQALAGFKHYENNYCVADLPASQMDIVLQDEGIRLKFS